MTFTRSARSRASQGLVGLCLLAAACGASTQAGAGTGAAAPGPYGARAAQALQSKPAVDFLRGMFDRVAFTIEDGGETFTVVDDGATFRVVGGAAAQAEFAVRLARAEAAALVDCLEAQPFGLAAQACVVAPLMVPAMTAALGMSINSNPVVIALANSAETKCVELENGAGTVVARIRVQYADSKWKVTANFDGGCERRMRIDGAVAQEFQRRLHDAMHENSLGGWSRFSKYEQAWRVKHTVAPAQPAPDAGR